MEECSFCGIAMREVPAVVLYEDADIIAFLDRSPVRRGHTQVIPKAHIDYFDRLPRALAGRILACGQLVAQRLKEVYGVERVAFLFTGGDIAHVHAHVIPIHEGTDVTSGRYIVHAEGLEWSAAHLRADEAELQEVRSALGEIAMPPSRED